MWALRWGGLALVSSVCLLGCASRAIDLPDGRSRSDLVDAVFKRRHLDSPAITRHDPVLALARDVTVIEDDLRRDGTITVKQPDVWGDGNLMHFLQEFDALLAVRTQSFDETLQAYIARSDQAELQSTTQLAAALGGNGPADSGSSTSAATSTTVVQGKELEQPSADGINLKDYDVFQLMAGAKEAAPPLKTTIGLEPTELARQQATFIDVCQSLRRRHMGDDNSRAAGYGLYKFRIPVSVLPGRETHQGHAAVVTLRAQLVADEANLRYTYPKLVVADLVDKLAPIIVRDWNAADDATSVAIDQMDKAMAVMTQLSQQLEPAKCRESLATLACLYSSFRAHVTSGKSVTEADTKPLEDACSQAVTTIGSSKCQRRETADLLVCELRRFRAVLRQMASADSSQPPSSPDGGQIKEGVGAPPVNVPITESLNVYGPDSVRALRLAAQEALGITVGRFDVPPQPELRAFLFEYLAQVYAVMSRNDVWLLQAERVAQVGRDVAEGKYETVKAHRSNWLAELTPLELETQLRETSWLVAVQAGILNQNLHQILEELQVKGQLSPDDAAYVHSSDVCFFMAPRADQGPIAPEVVRLWETIVRESFPLHVFTLDPQVEEQNVYDAFARRRELQLALAYSVARGRFNMAQKLAFSRQLALDQATIGLNRTCVGFSHGNDTFGWYFYPRVQSPSTESTNIGAIARTIWSTGPTETYDLKHRKLEPGMRECEVLVAMPSFVTNVRFDVTTNWESLAHPGVTKRSYEEMLAQSGRIHQLRMCLGNFNTSSCYRPGDVDRLISRIDQLEQMLGMQTYSVNVPYEYEQSGTDLFDRGDVHLKPVLTSFSGLEYLQPDDSQIDAHLFLTGKNFHPTLTHVIIGGSESHCRPDEASEEVDVEVISRELLQVRIARVSSKLSAATGFQVRVGTPAGISNALHIPPTPAPPAAAPERGWSFKQAPLIRGSYNAVCCPAGQPTIRFWPAADGEIRVGHNLTVPFPPDMNGLFVGEVAARKPDGTCVTFGTGQTKCYTIRKIPLSYSLSTPGQPASAEWVVSWSELAADIQTTLSANPPDIAGTDFTLTISGYVAFDKWPVSRMLNQLEIKVYSCGCGSCTPSGSPQAENTLEPSSLVPPPAADAVPQSAPGELPAAGPLLPTPAGEDPPGT
jgi:hypothetical protein